MGERILWAFRVWVVHLSAHMPCVLIVSPADLTPELGKTILWRSDIERLFAPSGEAGLDLARSRAPGLVVLDGVDPPSTIALVRTLRKEVGTRQMSVAVLARAASRAEEEELRRAGANLVLAGAVNPVLWDDRLEELLDVPPRREVRIPVRFDVWSHFAPENERLTAVALNISVRGVLLETEEAVARGTTLELTFCLPGESQPIQAVAQVVREGEIQDGRPRYGLEFLILKRQVRVRIEDFVATEARS
jgi:CheY-like chemotaxis protein